MQVSSRHTMRKEPKDRYHCFLYEDIVGKMRMAQVLFTHLDWCSWIHVLGWMKDILTWSSIEHLGTEQLRSLTKVQEDKRLSTMLSQRNMSWENHGKWISMLVRRYEKRYGEIDIWFHRRPAHLCHIIIIHIWIQKNLWKSR